MFSPCQVSIASITPEAFAAGDVDALAVKYCARPCVRPANHDDGMPVRSRPVEIGDPGDAKAVYERRNACKRLPRGEPAMRAGPICF